MDRLITRHVVPSAGVDIEVFVTTVREPVGRALVLVHGYGGSAAALGPLADLFSRAGYEAAAMSMRGFGGSTGVDDLGLQQPKTLVPLQHGSVVGQG